MTKEQIAEIVRKQQTYFSTGETLEVNTRIAALKKLRQAVKDNEEIIAKALKQDLG